MVSVQALLFPLSLRQQAVRAFVVSTLVHAGLVVGTILAGDAIARGAPWALVGAAALCLLAVFAIYRLRKRWHKTPE